MPALRLSPLSRNPRIHPLACLLTASCLLVACVQAPQQAAEMSTAREAGTGAATAGADVAETRAFPIETFYTLLVAEVAGNREQYDVALANYYHQAASTRDAGIAARATRIARFLNARRAALESARLWAELEPDSAEAQLAVTAELTLAGELDTALEHAELALALGGDAPLQSLAATAVSNRELTESVQPTFQRLADKYPENPEAALAHAMTLRATENYAEALAIVQRVQERHPDLLDPPLLESHLLVDQGKEAEAIAMLEKLVELYPQESRLRLQYARLLVSEDLERAQTQFTELVRQRPRDGNLILSLALIRFETEDLAAAKPLFERLLELEEHESAAHFYLGGIAEDEQRFEQAVTHYRQVGPGNDYLNAIKRGTELLATNGLSNDNRDWFAELRQRHPDQAEHFYLVEADLLRRHDRPEEALQLLDRAVEDHNDSGRLLYTQALVNEQLGNATEFEQGMRKLIARDPDNATLLNALGYKLTDYDDRLDEARELIEKALELRPDDPAIIDSMGWVEYRQGNHTEAVKYLEQALEKLPDHEIAAHLGEVLWMQGNREQAVKVWKRGLEINPESKIIPAAMERLRIRDTMEQHVSDS
ncbi:tetratricopeptide repeat protein [Microbulbifer sp. YPW16]|uniref:tetratricopeptide repeat protein n=1 Tax=unclassified Microbulbifer TaxID=2619833 RepID=UPI001E65A150|nr:tetratricopeptide repeat protein [Microbulbifer sp. YPW16]UHQ56391.1 tetratricopeptide repeat protein [Microbulbifer sp. YPW16]